MAFHRNKQNDVRTVLMANQNEVDKFGFNQREIRGSGAQEYLNTQQSAILSEAAYIFGRDIIGADEQKLEDTNSFISSTNFKVLPNQSTSKVLYMTKKTDDGKNHLHIAIKGETPESQSELREMIQEVRSGNKTNYVDDKEIEKVVRMYNPDVLTMSGHTVGGYAVNELLVNSNYLRDRIDQVDTFNATSDPNLDEKVKKNIQANDLEKLKDAVTQHRMRHSLGSKGLVYEPAIGNTITYDLKDLQGNEWTDKAAKLGEPNQGNQVITKNDIINMGATDRSLFASSIDNFSTKKEMDPHSVNEQENDDEEMDDAEEMEEDDDEDVDDLEEDDYDDDDFEDDDEVEGSGISHGAKEASVDIFPVKLKRTDSLDMKRALFQINSLYTMFSDDIQIVPFYVDYTFTLNKNNEFYPLFKDLNVRFETKNSLMDNLLKLRNSIIARRT